MRYMHYTRYTCSTTVTQVFDAEGGSSCSGTLKNSLCNQMVITALIGLPGYYVAVCLMDSWGRRNIQLQVT